MSSQRETCERGSPSQTKPASAAKFLPPRFRTGARGAFYENSDFENVWLEEFLSFEKDRNESIAKADLLNFTELPGSTVHPNVANHHLIRKKQSPNGGKPHRMGDRERLRLGELRKTLQKTAAAKSKATRGQKKLAPYVEANAKLSRVLKHIKPKANREDLQATQLNDFYALVTRETAAAVVLQSQCRRVMATKYVNRIALERSQATRIQCFVRGFFARRLLRRLKEERARAASMRAQLVRRHIARCRRRKRIKLEQSAAIVCQSAIRMFFAKQAVQLERLQQSWERNQLRWRAISTRLAWADLRINYYARQIQCVVRRKLAERRVSTMFAVHTEAAIAIQSVWRRYIAGKRKADIVYKLEVDKRCDKIRIIASEHRYWKQQVEELAKPAKLQRKNDLEAQKTNLENQRREKHEQIHALETHYAGQLQLHEDITPRAIAGGWEEQIQLNLKDTRERITEAKLDLFFGIQEKLLSVSEELDLIQSAEDEASASLVHWSSWQQAEQDKLWDFQRQHDREVEEREMRHRIIDEQLRWAVQHHTPSGKPDKRRPLVHGQAEEDDDRGSIERVQKMMEASKLRAENYQSALHMNHTFHPFNKLWSQYNALADNTAMFERGIGPLQQRQQPASFHGGLTSQDGDVRQPRKSKNKFPRKLDWELLDKVREERENIRARFERRL